MKTWVKWLLIIVAAWLVLKLLAVGGLFLLVFHSETQHSDDIAYYQALSGEIDGPTNIDYTENGRNVECGYDLPLLSELEPCEGYRFVHDDYTNIVATDFTYILIVTYDAENYQTRKAALDTDYTYRTEMIAALEEGQQVSPVFEMDGFSFRAVEQKWAVYPKQMLFVGTSDERRELAYIYCDNYDLDCIDESVEKHLKDVSSWTEIVSE